MSKFVGLLLALLAVEILLSWSGFAPNLSANSLLNTYNVFQNPESFSLSRIFTSISGILLATGAATLIAGFIFSDSRESFIIGSLVQFIMAFGVDFASIIQYVHAKTGTDLNSAFGLGDPFGYVIAFFYGLMYVLFAFSAISYWRGNDG